MKIIVSGSSGHLGEALVRQFRARGDEVIGIDLLPSPYTQVVDSILNIERLEKISANADAIFHAATLHKPHVATHAAHKFIDVNIHGTQNLLEAAVKNRVKAFIFTSTTSTFGNAMTSDPNAAVWVDEDLKPLPKNIYGVSKLAAEDLCQLASQDHALPCIVLKTSRFFPEDDDMKHALDGYEQDNIKAIEFLYRRVDIEDVVSAHEKALHNAGKIRFGKYIISATTPFSPSESKALMEDAPSVLSRHFPDYPSIFARKNWKMFPQLGRIYDNSRARRDLDWEPRLNFREILSKIQNQQKILSPLAYEIGEKGYHRQN